MRRVSGHLTILPPWWATWWRHSDLPLAFSGVWWSSCFVIRSGATRNVPRAIGSAEMDQVKTRLYTNNTHEFRTPDGYFRDGRHDQKTRGKGYDQRNADALLLLINQILDLAKLESGQMPLDLVCIDVVPYVQYITETFQSCRIQTDHAGCLPGM